MSDKQIGVAIMGRDATSVITNAQRAEAAGVHGVWLTTGGAGLDGMTLFGAVAMKTERVWMGTSIVPTWPRHPIVMAQQAQALEQIAPGRFRLGIGPSHRPNMEQMFGVDFRRPLSELKEYVRVLKALFNQASVDFDGEFVTAHARIPAPLGVPVMISALRRGSFEFAGAGADGAISWVSPGEYLRDVALPVMRDAAARERRPKPPLIVHAPVCVHDDREEVFAAAREQAANYPRLPFYAQMFADAGYPEAREGGWSEGMIDAVILSGNETRVAERIHELLSWGADEVLVQPITAGQDRSASAQRTLTLVGEVARELEAR